MLSIDILISTNASDEEKKKLDMPRSAIDEFLGDGYANNLYEGNVIFSCLPRAVNPEMMEIIINLKDVAETVIAWGSIINSVVKFINKSKGYEPSMRIECKKNGKEFSCDIPVARNSSEKEILEEVKKILKKL